VAALPREAIVGVIGVGVMGCGIAQVAATAGHPVLLFDVDPQAVARARAAIEQDLRRQVDKGRLTPEAAQTTLARLQPADWPALSRCALVIDAIVEDLVAKRELVARVQTLAPPECIVATNTSSLSITAIAAGSPRPERVVGMHFFNPPVKMRLVEVISGMDTAPDVVRTALDTAEAWGKKATTARSTPGFIVNRIARPFYGEAWLVLSENAASPATLDAIVRDCGGFPMGPFELMDLIGHDVNFKVTQSVFEATFGDRRYAPTLAQQELVRAGRLGRKSGRGIYDFRDGAPKPQPEVEPGSEPVRRIVAVGSLGIATPIITRLERAGIDVVRVQGTGIAASGGWLEIGTARLMLTDGRPATRRVAEDGHEHLVLFDLALDYATTPRLGVAPADQCGGAAFRTVCATLAKGGFACSPMDDVAGMIVLRTIAMLVNEAADAVAYGICTADAIDDAMRFGVNYPRGPMAWAESVGLDFFARVLAHLREHYGAERYRTSVLIQRRGWTRSGFRQ
jgi:3-hydroxybutyryl-CoA dehydrogenase